MVDGEDPPEGPIVHCIDGFDDVLDAAVAEFRERLEYFEEFTIIGVRPSPDGWYAIRRRRRTAGPGDVHRVAGVLADYQGTPIQDYTTRGDDEDDED